MSYEAETRRLGDFGYRERLDKLTETVTELIEMARIDHQTLRNILTRIEKLEEQVDAQRKSVTDLVEVLELQTSRLDDSLDRIDDLERTRRELTPEFHRHMGKLTELDDRMARQESKWVGY